MISTESDMRSLHQSGIRRGKSSSKGFGKRQSKLEQGLKPASPEMRQKQERNLKKKGIEALRKPASPKEEGKDLKKEQDTKEAQEAYMRRPGKPGSKSKNFKTTEADRESGGLAAIEVTREAMSMSSNEKLKDRGKEGSDDRGKVGDRGVSYINARQANSKRDSKAAQAIARLLKVKRKDSKE